MSSEQEANNQWAGSGWQRSLMALPLPTPNRALIDAGGSLVVIEHNLDVIKTADYVIDLAPEGGDAGGYVVATGTPEEIMKVKGSYTGRYLRQHLARSNGN